MRRRILSLTVGLLLSLTCAWGQALDLAKQLPVNNAKDPQASMTESMRILGELTKLGADGVKQLGAALGGADEAKVWFALNGLTNYAMRPGAETERAAVAAGLIDLVKTRTDADHRNRVLQLLQYVGRDDCIAAVAPLLADEAANDYAVRVLASIASPAAKAALLGGQAGLKGRSLANVARALGELGVKEANAGILPLAGSDDPVVKAAALYALAELGDAASRDALAKAAEATNKLERATNTALYLRWAGRAGEAGAAAARDLAKARAAEANVVVDANLAILRALGDKGLPEFVAALDNANPQVREGLLAASATVPGANLADALVAKLDGAKPELKAAILRTLGKRGAPQAAAALRAALDDADAAVRLAAVDAAAWLLPAGPGILLAAMGTDQPDLIAAAGARLARLGDEREVQALVLTIRSANNTAQAKRYLCRLGQAGGGAAWRVLGIFVTDPILGADAAAAVATALTPKAGTKPALTADNRRIAELAATVATDDATKAKLAALVGAPAGGPGRDTNLALNKPVFESDEHEADQVPENAVDGQFADRGIGWWTPAPASITINLQNAYRIDRVKVYTYWDGARAYQYTVDVSMDNKSWSQIVDKSKNETPSTEAGDEITFPATDAKFVRLNMLKNTANASMHVVEFMVFPVGAAAAPAVAGKSLTEGKPVTGEPEAEGDNVAERAVDGISDNTDQGWWAGGTPATLTVDLKETYKVDSAQVWFYWGGPRSYQWKVETSLDGKDWKLAADRTANTEETSDKGFVDNFPAVDARYVRLVVTKNSANPSSHVVEFKVFAAGTGPKAAAPAPVRVVEAPKPDADGFQALLYDKDLKASGWTGSTTGYELDDNGVLTCIPGKGGNLLTAKEYGDFHFKFEFQLTPGANNGVGIRAPGSGDAAYVGMEVQILDDRHEKYKEIKEWQAHGSIYGVCAAKRDLLKPVGEWNVEEIIAQGSKIKVIVNGQVAVDFDLASVTDAELIKSHPGIKNAKGRIGFLGHGDKVSFRNLKIKEL